MYLDHDVDLSRSRDVIGDMTIPLTLWPTAILHCTIKIQMSAIILLVNYLMEYLSSEVFEKKYTVSTKKWAPVNILQ